MSTFNKSSKQQTKCWFCINAVPNEVNGCSWSKQFEPIPGWKAIPTTVYRGKDRDNTAQSYSVIYCPEFKEG